MDEVAASADAPQVTVGSTSMPQLGIGLALVPPEITADLVATALRIGYRRIDSSVTNEAGLGEAVRSCGLLRSDVFVTTKLPNARHDPRETMPALHESVARLDIGPIDMYLIHWPIPSRDLFVEIWRVMLELKATGMVREVGVSNFQPTHLQRLVDETGVVPALNQIEVHPYHQQANLRAFHRELGVVTEAWSPLAQGHVLHDPTIASIARRHGCPPAQVVIRWHLQLGHCVTPKSASQFRIADNYRALELELDDHDMGLIATLDRGQRVGPDPETFPDS